MGENLDLILIFYDIWKNIFNCMFNCVVYMNILDILDI